MNLKYFCQHCWIEGPLLCIFFEKKKKKRTQIEKQIAHCPGKPYPLWTLTDDFRRFKRENSVSCGVDFVDNFIIKIVHLGHQVHPICPLVVFRVSYSQCILFIVKNNNKQIYKQTNLRQRWLPAYFKGWNTKKVKNDCILMGHNKTVALIQCTDLGQVHL